MFNIPLLSYLSDNFKAFALKFALFFLLFTYNLSTAFTQTEGWTSVCASNTPSVSEVMVDACGNEFQSEYAILRNGNQPFDISKLAINVVNPTNNAFVGQVTIGNGNLNEEALQILTDAAGAVCPYGTVFRNIFAPPYNGVVPENGVILFFVNKDSTDVTYLSPNTLTSLCGSKVFVAFGSLRPQSRGASIFRNYPQNGSCGAGGCLREIQFHFEGINAPFCTQLTYDIKKLPHLNTTNPPAGFNEGSYIRPNANGTIIYDGGNLTGNGVCISPDSLNCVIPPLPSYGAGFWNVSVFEGVNNFTHFKGFYQAKGNHSPSETASASSFEYNTARDGWRPHEAPSEAHPTYGALRAYDGCNVKTDSFSLLAQRKGFPCGDYAIKLVKYDDFVRIKIDADGDGTWDFDKTMTPPACSTGCGTTIWSGTLNTDSKMLIYSYDTRKDFNTTLIFDRKNTSPSPIQIGSTVSPTTDCTSATGRISLRLTGGQAPYNYTWMGATPIANNTLLASNLLSGVYKVVVRDNWGCRDSARILVPQTNSLIANAGLDTAFCAGSTVILRGDATGGIGIDYEWTTLEKVFISSHAKTSATPSISTNYVLKANDASGCFKTDTVFVKVNDAPYLTISISTTDTICNKDAPIFTAHGAQNYVWSTFPAIANTALSSQTGDKITLNALLLGASEYNIIATGTDANGCANKVQATISVKPCNTCLKNDTTRLLSTSCNPLDIGTTQRILKNINGCDSVIMSKITLSTKDSITINQTTCQSAFVGKNTLNLKNRNGCDSVVTTVTSLSKQDTVFIHKTSCNPLNLRQTHEIFRNISGCDSLVITRTTFTPLSIEALVTSPKCFDDKYGSIFINNVNGGTAPYKIFTGNHLNSFDNLPYFIPDLEVGKQSFTISDKNNCSKDTTFQIQEGRKLSLNLAKIAHLDLGDSLLLNSSFTAFFKSVKWTPSEGLQCDTCLPTIAKPLLSTVYNLQVRDTQGCQATENISIFVAKKQRIYAPNSFSPNGDGENDIFTIFTDASVARVKTLKIFNRWGNLLFESFDFTSGDESKGWNGTFKGATLASDVYIFFAEIEYKDGKKELFKGDVTLMR